jgi:hypothetical protein
MEQAIPAVAQAYRCGPARAALLARGLGREQEAWECLHRHDERAYSLVDAASFAVMRRLRLREALAFDGNFAAASFIELWP